ncbi:E3 ubiquitin-protein ligase MARCHF11 isoform X2 [Sebastes umbrosus]|uniref:E3 ubiquitin-protein ligase MARCHF11 isoform X2 n=1 Tax=Sebastes umbrosus TaxID=72105 RepID=UPI00189DF36B|nr:E3 ubiquitin-protein ligase MARCHF11 isoform X2 [Sebastes umbrosus]
MSTEEGEAGPACGGADTTTSITSITSITQHHTWDEGEAHGSQGRRQPEDEDEAGQGEEEEEEEEEEGRSCRDACEGNNVGDLSGEDGADGADGAVGGRSSCKEQTMHSNCSSDTCIPTPSCRICFQGAEQGDLLNPCRCDGSVRYTHQTCLLKWISERGCWTCELCCYRFHVIAINMKTPWQWQSITITLVEKVQIIAVFLGSLFLVASISWLLWSALSPQAVWQRRDVLFQICYGMYGFMDLVCVGRLDCPRGGSGVQRLHALAGRQPPLGRSELRQSEGHGGDERRPFLVVPQDALVASGHLRAQRPFASHPAGASAMDLPLFGPLLSRLGAPKQPQSGQ